ncbi:MAG: hypothetical protein CMJ24_07905, partial [Phycisphaerae bacterium]|nr:hypothetical protein [Phycisphaerae bacterium]
AEEATIVFSWLDELNQQEERDTAYSAACEELSSLLDSNADMNELEKTYFRVSQFDMGVPQLLETRYAARKEDAERGRKVKLLSMSIASIAAIAVIAVLATLYIRHADQTGRRDAFEAAIDRAIVDENYAVLQELVQTGPADFPNQFPEQLNLARTMLQEDKTRSRRFRDLYAQLASKQSSGALLEIPKPSLEELAGLARLSEEIERSDDLRARWDEARNRQTASQLSAMRKIFEAARIDLKDINANMTTTPEGVSLEACRKVQTTIRSLRADLLATEGSSQLASQLDDLSASLNETRTQIRDAKTNRDEAMALYDRVRHHHDTQESFLATLRNLQAISVPAEHRTQLEQTLQSSKMLGHIEAWNEIARTLPSNHLALQRWQDSEMHELSHSIWLATDSLPADHSLFGKNLTPLRTFLESRAMHLPEYLPTKILHDFLSPDAPWSHPKLNRLVTKQGNYYALSPNARLEENKQGKKEWMLWGSVMTSRDIENRNVGLTAIDPKAMPNNFDATKPMSKPGVIQWMEQAKQQKRLATPPASNPLVWYIDLLEILLAVEDMEPTVQLALAARLADMHQQLSWPSIPELETLAAYAGDEPPSTWPNPTVTSQERSLAQEQLLGLDASAIKRWKESVSESIQKLNENRPRELIFSGCIWVNEQGNRTIYLYDNANRTGELLTLARSRNGSIELMPIAHRNAGILILAPEGSDQHETFHAASLGMPIFILNTD